MGTKGCRQSIAPIAAAKGTKGRFSFKNKELELSACSSDLVCSCSFLISEKEAEMLGLKLHHLYSHNHVLSLIEKRAHHSIVRRGPMPVFRAEELHCPRPCPCPAMRCNCAAVLLCHEVLHSLPVLFEEGPIDIPRPAKKSSVAYGYRYVRLRVSDKGWTDRSSSELKLLQSRSTVVLLHPHRLPPTPLSELTSAGVAL